MNKRSLQNVFFESNWKPPKISFGYNCVRKVTNYTKKFVIVTSDPPRNFIEKDLTVTPTDVILAKETSRRGLHLLTKEIPPVELVIGIGGGIVMDTAKYVALKADAALIQIPTIISNDAWISDPIAFRDDWKIHYEGHIFPDEIVFDFGLIQRAPKRLNRYGACDILSMHTALCDWKLATSRGQKSESPLSKGDYNEEVAAKARNLLRRLYKHRRDIYQVSETGIRTLVDLYMNSIKMAQNFGSYRFQEGSEHFFAYDVEHVTRKQYIHGALLGLGIFVMAYLQENDFEYIVKLMDDIGLEYGPILFGLERDDLIRTILNLKAFGVEERFPYTIINEVKINRGLARTIADLVY